ncbi:hypothetical protein H6F95_20520 [Cyanobacteria bacterium FACHB-471]|nr:hypothetical protein [Cyanobacteria bacterium FACHB-471]
MVFSKFVRIDQRAMRKESSLQSLSSLDVDEELLEVLLLYLDKLIVMGVDLNYLPLQQAIEGHVNHLETACRALIGYAGWLAHCGDRFNSEIHATKCFIKALVERWEPHPTWEDYADLVAQSRYVSPYERARILIYELNCKDSVRTWKSEILEHLSDKEIEELIPNLQNELNAL